MKKALRVLLPLLLLALLLFARLPARTAEDPAPQQAQNVVTDTLTLAPETAEDAPPAEEAAVDEDGSYTTAEDVALYIHTYGHLPSNFITKKQAQALGWSGGEVEEFRSGAAIGGDYFGNYEGLLPKKKGRKYYECDIGTVGKRSRGAERIVFSNDGLIYYTADHYESFTLLYGEE